MAAKRETQAGQAVAMRRSEPLRSVPAVPRNESPRHRTKLCDILTPGRGARVAPI